MPYSLDRLAFSTSDASRITGVPVDTMRAWQNRHKLFPEMEGPGRGNRASYDIHRLLGLCVVDELTSIGLSVSAATFVARAQGITLLGYRAQLMYISRNHEGRWVQYGPPEYGKGNIVTITINVAELWDRIRPRIAETIKHLGTEGALQSDAVAHLLAELDVWDALAWDDREALGVIARDDSRPAAIRDMAAEHATRLDAMMRKSGT